MERYQKTFDGLGTTIVLTLVSDNSTMAHVVLGQLQAHTEQFEKQFSRFLPESELSKVNRSAGKATQVTPAFTDLLRTALRFAELTDGLYNPAILPDLQRAGYANSWKQALTTAPNYEDRRLAQAAEIRLEAQTVTLPAGAAIDFGGIGKGYLVRQLSRLVPQTFVGLWLSLGGDIACRGVDITGQPFTVAVASVRDGEEPVATLGASPGLWAVATSGITKRQGVKEGRPWHHIIDPRTGHPARTDVLSATVTADDPVVADIAAKCAVIMGSAHASEILAALGVGQAVLQTSTQIIRVGGNAA